jgi:glutaconate CoA-transferase subunit B
MVATAAREIADGELVFVGMRLPMLAFLVAKRTHAPSAVGLYENGLIRETPSPELLYTMADPPNIRGATQCGQMLDVMALLQQGRVQLGFLGAAEVDRFGNLNSTWGDRHGEMQRLPGSGGACDIACLAQRTVVLLAHERTTLGVLRFGSDGEAFLASVHPGIGVEDVLANTGWTLRVADTLEETLPPTRDELAAMRALDPNHFWTK